MIEDCGCVARPQPSVIGQIGRSLSSEAGARTAALILMFCGVGLSELRRPFAISFKKA
jgi:hypothetical protein